MARSILLTVIGSMATLDRPIVPSVSQWYPVIWFRPAGPDGRPWWPPTYEGAPNTLRVVTMEDAAKRLALDLQRTLHSRGRT